MALLMPKLVRCPKTAAWVSRKVIPADVKDTYHRLYGVRAEALFRAPMYSSQAEAKRLFADWIGEVESRIASLRAASSGLGRTLSQREAVALAGEWRRWFVVQHEENPGHPDTWENVCDEFASEYRRFAPPDAEYFDPDESWTRGPKIAPKVRPVVYKTAEVERFLAAQRLYLQPGSLDLFLDLLLDVLVDALILIKKRAAGDYSPDSTASRFPRFDRGHEAGIGVWSLWEAWISEKKPKPATIDRWRAVFLHLSRMFPDAGSISEQDARTWAYGLTSENRSAQTVQEVWINAAKTIFSWARSQKRIDTNPFADIKVTVPKRVRNRETKAFRSNELATILRATLLDPPPRLARHYASMRRWVPWICAYSGSRAGEITQLRREDVIQLDGVWALRLTPEAGTIKSGEARLIPIHEHLIEQGFLDFVRDSGNGPLFYDPAARRKVDNGDPTKPGQPQAVKSRNKLAGWVRDLGVDDPELSPNHAWRHTFKQVADRHGVSERVSDAITGHAPQSEGRKYGQPTLVDMAAALTRFPRYVF
ncbi:MAG TPA: hypothetical protein VIL09_16665 [Microvirga sp.]|jgi:integrase